MSRRSSESHWIRHELKAQCHFGCDVGAYPMSANQTKQESVPFGGLLLPFTWQHLLRVPCSALCNVFNWSDGAVCARPEEAHVWLQLQMHFFTSHTAELHSLCVDTKEEHSADPCSPSWRSLWLTLVTFVLCFHLVLHDHPTKLIFCCSLQVGVDWSECSLGFRALLPLLPSAELSPFPLVNLALLKSLS